MPNYCFTFFCLLRLSGISRRQEGRFGCCAWAACNTILILFAVTWRLPSTTFAFRRLSYSSCCPALPCSSPGSPSRALLSASAGHHAYWHAGHCAAAPLSCAERTCFMNRRHQASPAAIAYLCWCSLWRGCLRLGATRAAVLHCIRRDLAYTPHLAAGRACLPTPVSHAFPEERAARGTRYARFRHCALRAAAGRHFVRANCAHGAPPPGRRWKGAFCRRNARHLKTRNSTVAGTGGGGATLAA